MPTIRPHGKGFQVRYYSDGKRQHEPFETVEAAEIRVKEIELSKKKGISVDSKPSTIKFGELAKAVVNDYRVNEYSSVDDIECRFRLHLEPYFGKRKAISITAANITAYILERKEEGAVNGTINRELEAMHRAFSLGMEQGTVLQMPLIKKLKEDNVRVGFFSRSEVDRLCSFLKDPLRSMVLFGFLTGWRLGEIRKLLWRNVDKFKGEIRLDPGKSTKNREARVFPLTLEIRSLFERLAGAQKAEAERMGLKGVAAVTPYVFAIHRKPVGEFRKTWARACHLAGLPCTLHLKKDAAGKVALQTIGKQKGQPLIERIKAHRIFHDLRRSAVREFVRQGIPERVAMMLTGHKTRSVFDRYSIVSESDLQIAVEKIDGAKNGAKPAHGPRKTQ